MFKNREGKVRSGWKILGMLVMLIFILVILSIGFEMLINQIAGFQTTNRLYSRLFIPMMLLQEIVMMGVPIFIWRYLIKSPLGEMGLTPWQTHKKDFYVGLGLGAFSITLVFLLLLLTGNARVVSWVPVFTPDTFTYLVLFVFVGFAEEILGRGYILSVLRQTRNLPLSLLVSGLIFGLMHLFNNAFSAIALLNISLVGVLLGLMYIWSGNIWMCIGYHITWNYFQGNVFGLPVSGVTTSGLITTSYQKATLLNGGAFGPEGGLLVTGVILLGLLFVYRYYQNTGYHFFQNPALPSEKTKDDLQNNGDELP